MKTEEKEVKEEASSLLWPGVRIYHADLDEATDAAESTDFVLSPTHHILADEEETISFFEELDLEDEVESGETPEPVILFENNNYENLFDSEPTHLGKNDAKDYTRSAAPTFRGRICLNILRVSGKQVFA